MQAGDSDEEGIHRALSDKWLFRRKQKKWLRRRDTKMAAQKDSSHFSSSEDLHDEDHTPENDTPTTELPTSPMLVSELRKSLTGLDRAVKTYSFMVSEDQLPSIEVTQDSELPEKTLLQKSSDFSSFDSEEDYVWETNPYPSGGMDNFATGMMDTFESNLLKLKDFQTQSLPDVFEATKHYHDDGGSSDASPLSSASVSTVSILDSVDIIDASRESPGSGAGIPRGGGGSSSSYPLNMSPLALNGCTSPKDAERSGEETATSSSDGVSTGKVQLRRRPDRVSSAGSCHTWESSSSHGGSESSEREGPSGPSPQPLALERLRTGSLVNALVNGVSGSNGVLNGMESPHSEISTPEEASKRHSKISVTSSKHEEPQR